MSYSWTLLYRILLLLAAPCLLVTGKCCRCNGLSRQYEFSFAFHIVCSLNLHGVWSALLVHSTAPCQYVFTLYLHAYFTILHNVTLHIMLRYNVTIQCYVTCYVAKLWYDYQYQDVHSFHLNFRLNIYSKMWSAGYIWHPIEMALSLLQAMA